MFTKNAHGKRVNNVSEYLTWVAGLKRFFKYEDYDVLGPWFRGQHKDWPLYPKIYRPEYGGYARLKGEHIEDEIREQFITQAHIFCETKPAGDDDWEWYFLMQHFGAPTRLLDWTEGALLGLYFSVRGNPGYYDSVVWALDPYGLNEKSIRRSEVIPPSATGVDPKDKKLVNPWLPTRFKGGIAALPEGPIAVFPTHIARRISSQRSCFTLHGKDRNGLDERKNRGRLVKIIIPSFRVVDIRRELEDSGINETTIFPDLEGLSRSLCLKWRLNRHKDPHEQVYTRLRPSPNHGVGVFAIRRIKKDQPLFLGDNEEIIWIEEDHLPKAPREIRKLYDDFPIIDKERRYGCPLNFNRLTMSWYLNEPESGHRPNVYCVPESYDFVALRDIKQGEELTVKYKDYSEVPAIRVLRKSSRTKTFRK